MSEKHECMQEGAIATLQTKADETRRREEDHALAHNAFAINHAELHKELSDAISTVKSWKDEWSGAAKALALILSLITVACGVMTYFNDQRTRNIENEIRTYSSLNHDTQQDNQWGKR